MLLKPLARFGTCKIFCRKIIKIVNDLQKEHNNGNILYTSKR